MSARQPDDLREPCPHCGREVHPDSPHAAYGYGCVYRAAQKGEVPAPVVEALNLLNRRQP